MATPAAYNPKLERTRGLPDNREMLFLEAYYGADSETRGNQVQSAKKAGYTDSVAVTKATRIIKRFGTGSAAQSLNAAGVNKPYLAMRIRYVLETGKSQEILSGARLAYALLGETTDESKGGVNNTYNAPVMVIVGANSERLRALRGAVPQLSKEQQEELDNERCQNRLEALKRGELPQLPSRSQGRGYSPKAIIGRCQYWNIRRGKPCTCGYHEVNHDEVPILDVQSRPVECDSENAAGAG